MKQKLLTVSQLAELLNVKSQGLYAKIKADEIIRNEDGFIDILHPVNKLYLKERSINALSVKIPDEGKPGRPVVNRSAGKITIPSSGLEKSNSELNRELTQKKIEKLQQEIDRKNKVLLPTEFIEKFLFTYIETLNTTIERTASVGISDFGKKILESGEVTSSIREEFVNLFLTACHQTKMKIIKSIKTYNPNTGVMK